MSEIFLTQKVVFEADAILYICTSLLYMNLSFFPFQTQINYLPMRQTLHISIEVQLTLLINSTCSCIEVCYDNEEQQQEGKTFACLS